MTSRADAQANARAHGARALWTRSDDPRAAPLVAELSREYDERYGLNDGIPSSFELQRYPAHLFAPSHGGGFLLLVPTDGSDDGAAIAGGAFKRLDDTTAEIKRVWTSSAHRRRGLARRVMAELEHEAALRGYREVELTTGARQPEAVALYLGLGYAPRFDLDGDLEAISYLTFAKTLDAALAARSA
jgi:GNAT superfamily N-acetyltransferase